METERWRRAKYISQKPILNKQMGMQLVYMVLTSHLVVNNKNWSEMQNFNTTQGGYGTKDQMVGGISSKFYSLYNL